MADELQALLNRINEEGLKKANTTTQELVDQARVEAKQLLQKARDEADGILVDAKREAQLLVDKGGHSLRQAARDLLLSLREQLQERLSRVGKSCVAAALDADTMSQILLELVRAYVAEKGTVDRIDILLNEKQLAELQTVVNNKLGEDLRDNCHLAPTADIETGFKVVFDGADLVYDFSDEALAEALSSFLNPKLAAVLQGESA